MYSLGGKVVDFYDDPGLTTLAASPYFEKVASLPVTDPEKIGSLEDRQFGVVFLTKEGRAIRKFPVHDYPNTVLSNVYFELTHPVLPVEAKVAAATQIRDASRTLGVKPMPAVEKYAAEGTLEGANYVRLQNIKTSHASAVDFFRQLSDEYEANRDRYGREDKRKLAEAMSGVAEKYGLEIPTDLKPFVLKDPELDKEALFAQCAFRKQLIQDRTEAVHLLDEFLEKSAGFDPKETVKLLETFDRQFGLDCYWTRGLEPNTLLMEKTARHGIPLSYGGRKIGFSDEEVKAWMATNADLVTKMFGRELADRLKADIGAIWSLPTASREFLEARIEHARDNTPAKAK